MGNSKRLVVVGQQRTWFVGLLTDDLIPVEDPSAIYSPHFDKSIRLLTKPQALIFRLNKKYMNSGFKVNKIGGDGAYLIIYYDPNEKKAFDYTPWDGWRGKIVWAGMGDGIDPQTGGNEKIK